MSTNLELSKFLLVVFLPLLFRKSRCGPADECNMAVCNQREGGRKMVRFLGLMNLDDVGRMLFVVMASGCPFFGSRREIGDVTRGIFETKFGSDESTFRAFCHLDIVFGSSTITPITSVVSTNRPCSPTLLVAETFASSSALLYQNTQVEA
jgi:hypothetical protein